MTQRLTLNTRETTTEPYQFQLMAGTSPLPLTGVGTVELWMRDRQGGVVSFTTAGTAAKLQVNGTAGGSVLFAPGSADLAAGSAPYQAYFKLWTGQASWYYVPEDSELTINIRSVFG